MGNSTTENKTSQIAQNIAQKTDNQPVVTKSTNSSFTVIINDGLAGIRDRISNVWNSFKRALGFGSISSTLPKIGFTEQGTQARGTQARGTQAREIPGVIEENNSISSALAKIGFTEQRTLTRKISGVIGENKKLSQLEQGIDQSNIFTQINRDLRGCFIIKIDGECMKSASAILHKLSINSSQEKALELMTNMHQGAAADSLLHLTTQVGTVLPNITLVTDVIIPKSGEKKTNAHVEFDSNTGQLIYIYNMKIINHDEGPNKLGGISIELVTNCDPSSPSYGIQTVTYCASFPQKSE